MISDDWKTFDSSVIWLNWWFAQVDLQMARAAINTLIHILRVKEFLYIFFVTWIYESSTIPLIPLKTENTAEKKKNDDGLKSLFLFETRINWLMNAAKKKYTWCQYEICLCPLKRRFLQVLLQIDSLKFAKMICILFAILEEKLQCVQRMPIILEQNTVAIIHFICLPFKIMFLYVIFFLYMWGVSFFFQT